MPELPEVHTIVTLIRPRIKGKTIASMWSDTPRLFRMGKGRADFEKRVIGKKITDVTRIGKNITVHLSDGSIFLIHLMMTGWLLMNPPESERRHIRLRIQFTDGDTLALSDIRKFGMVRHHTPELKIGTDALSMPYAEFHAILKNRKTPMKSLLLNQSLIGGIGNIYSDEILWRAGVRPARKAASLKESEIKALFTAMKFVLNKAIKKEGTSSRDYRKPDGSEGGYYAVRTAYQRTGEQCGRKDGGIIKRIVIGQRSAHFCPVHQR